MQVKLGQSSFRATSEYRVVQTSSISFKIGVVFGGGTKRGVVCSQRTRRIIKDAHVMAQYGTLCSDDSWHLGNVDASMDGDR